jgi:hypothetical protein
MFNHKYEGLKVTKEGRLQTHLNCLSQGKASPYAEEFANHDEKHSEIKKETPKASKEARKGGR